MRVLVVGGGSAGWITAAYLNASLNTPTQQNALIGLIESEKIGRIGVGEATIPTIKRTLARIGMREVDFMKATDATFKQAIRFDDWVEPGHHYYHPFDRLTALNFDYRGLKWLASNRSVKYAKTVTPQTDFCDEGLGPKHTGYPDYQGTLAYAYHLDAEKFGDALRDFSKARGVQHMIDDVVEVEQHENGDIAAVKTESGKRIEADLFVDCTGFFRLLIGKTLGVEYQSYADWLLCDRACAMQIPYSVKPVDNVQPYTKSTALEAGWVWDIGLRNRRGTGYVYSSQFLSEDEAEARLRDFQGPHTKDLKARHIKFATGRIKTPWTKNVVAIGLSAGFLEPLESTGLFFAEEGVDYLAELFPRLGDMEKAREIYNRRMNERYEEALDFINLHYVLSKRRDTPFWREATSDHRTTPRIKEYLSRWEQKPPSRLDFVDQVQLFSSLNYEFILYGMDWTPKKLATPPPQVGAPDLSKIDQTRATMRKELVQHNKLLKELVG